MEERKVHEKQIQQTLGVLYLTYYMGSKSNTCMYVKENYTITEPQGG